MAEKTKTYEDYVAELSDTFAQIARLERQINEAQSTDDGSDRPNTKPMVH